MVVVMDALALAGHAANWMRANGYGVRENPRLEFVGDYGQTAGRDGERFDPMRIAAFARDSGITVGPAWQERMRGLAGRVGQRGQLPLSQMRAGEILAHELMHQTGPLGDFGEYTDEQAALEEGAAQASTLDALPAFFKQMYGSRWVPADSVGMYQQQVDRLRKLSTIATGSGKFQDRGARVWRRDFQNADLARREEMMRLANERLAAWQAERSALPPGPDPVR